MRGKPLPKSVTQAIGLVLKPYFGHIPDDDKIAEALEPLRYKYVTVAMLAEARGLSKEGMQHRLHKAGVKPVMKGGPSGREFIYEAHDVVGI